MAKRPLLDQLDQAIDALLVQPHSAAPDSGTRMAAMLRLAASLRGLPRPEFKSSLKTSLIQRGTMATTTSYVREGHHCITPYLIVPEAANLIQFLKEAFGGEEKARYEAEGGRIMHAEVKIGDSMVELGDAGPQWPARPMSLHLYVEDADAVYERAVGAGAESVYKPMDQPYGDREGGVKDAGGNYWWIATHKGPHYIPEGLRTVTPFMLVPDASSLIGFLQRSLQAEEVLRHPPEGKVMHAKLRIGDSMIEIGEAHRQLPVLPATIHLYVSDVDAAYSSALEAGAASLAAPEDKPYGERSAAVEDTHGNLWFLARPLALGFLNV
jgi:uncharacterized glyoxalase superfamily protein PhnB